MPSFIVVSSFNRVAAASAPGRPKSEPPYLGLATPSAEAWASPAVRRQAIVRPRPSLRYGRPKLLGAAASAPSTNQRTTLHEPARNGARQDPPRFQTRPVRDGNGSD